MAKKKEERLDYRALTRALSAEGPGRLYLLWGPEDYLREAFLDELHKTCVQERDDFGDHRLDGGTLDMRTLSDAVNALPFLTERTFVEVRGFDLNRCRDEDAEELERIVSDIPDYCTLVFVQGGDYEPDWRLKAAKSIKKHGQAVKFTAQGEGQLLPWIKKRFAALGKTVGPEAAAQLIYLSGDLMNGLIPEIEKIAASVPGDRVTAEDVARYAHHLPEAKVFDMTDRLAARDYDGAARLLAELLDSGEEPIRTLAVIGMQFRRLYAARVALDEKLGETFVSQVCGIRYAGITARLMATARGFSAAQLRRAVELCTETDYAMKSAETDDAELLKTLFVRLAEETA